MSEVPGLPPGRKGRPRRLIRWGLWLVPWLPTCLLAMVGYTLLFAPRQYRVVTVMEIKESSLSGLPPSIPVLPAPAPWYSFLPRRINPPLAVLICTTLAFLVGYVQLVAGVCLLIRRDAVRLEAS